MILLTEILGESRFRDIKAYTHIIDVPMFSIYLDNTLLDKVAEVRGSIDKIKKVCNEARYGIHRIGFPSMHCNIIIMDLSKVASGLAVSYKKYMKVNFETFMYLDDITVGVIVHEWAHLWMFNKSKEFKNAVEELYKRVRGIASGKVGTVKDSDVTVDVLDAKEEMKILKIWGDVFDNIGYNMKDNSVLNYYIMKKVKISLDLLKFLPHGFSIKGKLKKELPVESLTKMYKTLPIGVEVYAEKVGGGWIIGEYSRDVRYEKYIEDFGAIIEYVESTMSSNILDDIQLQVKSKKLNKKECDEIIVKMIESNVSRGLDDISRAFRFNFSDKDEEILNSWLNRIIIPYFFIVLKNMKVTIEIMKNPKRAYDILWVSNKLKETENISMVKFITKCLHRNKVVQFKKDIVKSPDFTDPDVLVPKYSNEREVLVKLNNWVRAYGMSNDDEMWATAIDSFFKLSPKYRKEIVKLML